MPQFDITKENTPFSVMLNLAEPKDRIIYHKGPFGGGPHMRPAQSAFEAGKCILFQKRREVGGRVYFEYTAQKTSKCL